MKEEKSKRLKLRKRGDQDIINNFRFADCNLQYSSFYEHSIHALSRERDF